MPGLPAKSLNQRATSVGKSRGNFSTSISDLRTPSGQPHQLQMCMFRIQERRRLMWRNRLNRQGSEDLSDGLLISLAILSPSVANCETITSS